MLAQHLAQTSVQQMCSRVIAHGGLSNLSIDRGVDFVPHADCLFSDDLMRADPLNRGIAAFDFGDDRVVIVRVKPSTIADLSAGFSVERRVIEDDLAFIAGLEFLCTLAIVDDGQHFAKVGAGLAVAFEFRLWKFLVCGIRSLLAGALPGGTGTVALLGHGAVETRLIEGDALIASRVLHEVEGHAEGVIESEGMVSRISRREAMLFQNCHEITNLTPRSVACTGSLIFQPRLPLERVLRTAAWSDTHNVADSLVPFIPGSGEKISL